MNLRHLLILTTIVGTNLSIAGTMGPVIDSDNYNGFYLGADIGASDLNVKEVAPANAPAKLETHNIGNVGVVGGGLVGYDYSLTEQFKLGLEGFINANEMNATAIHDFNFSRYKVKSRYNAGVRILPGYAFSQTTVGHILLGYSNARYKISDNGVYGFMRDEFNKGGFQGGLGMKTAMWQNFSVRLDGLYTAYGKKRTTGVEYIATTTAIGSGTGIGLANGIVNPYKNSLSSLEVNLTLLYKFNV